MLNIRDRIESLLASGTPASPRPALRRGNESNIKGMFVIGDLAGAPVIKLAMAQGVEVVDYISELPDMRDAGQGTDADPYDVIIVGAGAAGLNAALAAAERGWRYLVLEKSKIANTIENFPEGKWVYAEPDSKPAKGKLWLDGATKEDLIARWHQIIHDNDLAVHTEEAMTSATKESDGTFTVKTEQGEYRTRKIIIASGQRGNPRYLKVPGEEQERVYHRLYAPRKYKNEKIIVVGGGNSAIEAALTLSEQNDVTISYRKDEFSRLFKDNREQMDAAIEEGRITTIFNSNVTDFGDGVATVSVDDEGEQQLEFDHAFVLIGAEVPVKFLKSLGLRLENEWTGSLLRSTLLTIATLLGLWCLGPGLSDALNPVFGVPPVVGGLIAAASGAALLVLGFRGDRWAWLGISFIVWYTIYGVKVEKGREFWPFRGWGYESLSFFDRPWAFWYTVMYTALMTVFGIPALKRWGLDRKDKFQIWRFASLIGFQWTFFFIIPEFLFQFAVKYQWVGEALASDPQFADQAWRSYGLVIAWPLFFYTFFYDPHWIWVLWGVLLTFVVIPVFVLFNGKRYCSWICGCGGLAETFGDRWRHLAPKGKTSINWEKMNMWILIFAVGVTLLMLAKDTISLFQKPANWGITSYRIIADVWLIGILPVTLYPFMGGKVWCRYWCPLAKMMGIASKLYVKFGLSRFHIVPNDKCIACNECSRYCQVGIDVMQYALKQETLNNETSSCIGCGICVSVCPMDTLSFSSDGSISLPILDLPSSATALSSP